MAGRRLSTGNRFIAIPDVLTQSAGMQGLNFVSMHTRSILELRGTETEPFLRPEIKIGGRSVDMSAAQWVLERYWIPSFSLSERGIEIRSRLYAPLSQRGFIWVIEAASRSDEPLTVELGWQSNWTDTAHVLNVSKPVEGLRCGSVSTWRHEVPFVEFRAGTPQFAVAFAPSEPMMIEITNGARVTGAYQGEVTAAEGEALRLSLSLPITLGPGEHRTIALHVGLGLEETSAVSTAIDIERRGWETLYSDLAGWLEAHKLSVKDEHLDRILNINAFYNFFFSQAMTLDTEELVLLSGRSSRHDASATYKDRDAMRWSLPAVLTTSPAQARHMIEYTFTVQLRNVGIDSRFIDGMVMRPGFKLDELCAPIRALSTYVRATRDMSILFDRRVQSGVNRIRHHLSQAQNPSANLYETMLTPSGEVAAYPYVTYDNVLAWRAIQDLAWMYELIHDLDRAEENAVLARSVQKAIMKHCVVDGPYGLMFAHSVDLLGGFELGDDPLGSLKLLSWFEFCSAESPIYQSTVKWIHSHHNPYSFHDAPFATPGCREEPHPHILGVVNDLLTGRIDEAIDFLRRTEMDDGIACLSVDENTGQTLSGPAFASCAGYLAFALSSALGAAPVPDELEPSDRLYEPPPPEIRDSMESSRL
jgi:hypothetical protein